MKKVVVSAPGKLILSGEHAVVHGKPALVVSTSKRMCVTLKTGNGKNSLHTLRKTHHYFDAIVALFEKKYHVTVKELEIGINSEIPQGVGMGSSAALAVATIGALQVWYDQPWNPQEINELAFQAEKVQHGTPSGTDPTIVTHGGLLWYRKELEFLKTFWLLPFKIPKNFAPFVLINTGRSESTKELVVGVVGALQKKDPDAFTLLASYVEEVTRSVALMIHDENEKGMREMITQNERLLEKMGVVSTATQKLIREIEKSGGSAKMSGAGGVKTGSGIVIATHDKPKVLVDLATRYGYPTFQVELGGEGVRREQVVV